MNNPSRDATTTLRALQSVQSGPCHESPPHESFWEDCRSQLHRGRPPAARLHSTFYDYIADLESTDTTSQLGSNFTAALLEFRALERQLNIWKVLQNLPVDWRVQVVERPSVTNTTEMLWPKEVAAGKVVTSRLLVDSLKKEMISQVLTDRRL